jgi:hypothetical protein
MPITTVTADENTRNVATDAASLRALATLIEASGRPLDASLRHALRVAMLAHTATPVEIREQTCVRCGRRHDVDQTACRVY